MQEDLFSPGLQKRPTQCQRVLQIFKDANGGWVDGMIFHSLDKPITQFHSRMNELQKQGYEFEPRTKEGKNWKEYRLIT